MRKSPPTKPATTGHDDSATHATIARLAEAAGKSAAEKLTSGLGAPSMNLYYVVTPEKTCAIIAAPSLEAAQEIPPYSNWRDLVSFGGWDAEAGKRCRYTCIASPSTLDPNSAPGVLVAGGMGFYSERENAVKFI